MQDPQVRKYLKNDVQTIVYGIFLAPDVVSSSLTSARQYQPSNSEVLKSQQQGINERFK